MSLLLVELTMICIFLKMYTHFLKVKRNAMEEKLVSWKCKNTMHVVGAIGIVILSASRSIINVLTT